MSDKMNRAIQEISVKHGVVLSKDDPILMLHTMNERLLEETRQAQQEMLTQFREEMEAISSQWKDDAKEKAEKVLNAALVGGKEAMEKTLKESTKESVLAMRKMLSESLAETHDLKQQTKTYSWTSFLSAVMLAGTCLAIYFSMIF